MTRLEAAQGIFGAWRLLHFDRGGLQYFRATREGFVNSFWAAALVLPGDALATSLFANADPAGFADSGIARIVAVYLLFYVIKWVLFPLAMAGFTEAIQRSEFFVIFVVAHNWSHVVRITIVLPAAMLFAADGIDSASWGALIFFTALMAAWAYAWFVARAALGASGLVATAVVGIEIAITVVLSWIAGAMT